MNVQVDHLFPEEKLWQKLVLDTEAVTQIPQVASLPRIIGQGLPAQMATWCSQKDVCKHALLWKPALYRDGQVPMRSLGEP